MLKCFREKEINIIWSVWGKKIFRNIARFWKVLNIRYRRLYFIGNEKFFGNTLVFLKRFVGRDEYIRIFCGCEGSGLVKRE